MFLCRVCKSMWNCCKRQEPYDDWIEKLEIQYKKETHQIKLETNQMNLEESLLKDNDDTYNVTIFV